MYRLIVSTLMAVVFTVALAISTDAVAKKDGNGGGSGGSGNDGGGDPPAPGPTSCPGDFPAFAYQTGVEGRRGGIVSQEIFVSNAEGTCQVRIAAINDKPFVSSMTFAFDEDDGVYRVVYESEEDKGDTRKTGSRPSIRVLEFSVSSDLETGYMQVDQPLPITPEKVWTYGGDATGGQSIYNVDLSGASLVFALDEGSRISVQVIEDVRECLDGFAQNGQDVDDSCADEAFAHDAMFLVWGPSWGLDTNRIYFISDTTDVLFEDVGIAILDRADADSPWSAPGVLRRQSDDNTDDIFWHRYSSVLRGFFGAEPQEAYVMRVQRGGEWSTEVVSISPNCTAALSSVDSCLAQGLASVVSGIQQLLVNNQPVDNQDSWHWTTHTTIGEGPNLLIESCCDPGNIYEFDPDTGDSVLIWTGSGLGNVAGVD